MFDPARLLASVLARLSPGGVMLIVNQGDEEHAAQRALLDAAGVAFDVVGAVESVLSPFLRPRLGLRVRG